MRLLCLACEVLSRPLYACAAASPHIVDIHLVRRGLHNIPAELRARLQAHIDSAQLEVGEQKYDAIVLGYGLCGQAVAGLSAREVPLVVPRAHDCITLFLGSRELYRQQFEDKPGTYWYSLDYIEREDGKSSNLSMGSGSDTQLEEVYDEYVRKYGRENADYLMEVMGAWQQHYRRAAYIDMGVGDGAKVQARAQADAARRGWLYEVVAGDLVLVRRLLNGDWDADFLVIPPGQQVAMTFDDEVITCRPPTEPPPAPPGA